MAKSEELDKYYSASCSEFPRKTSIIRSPLLSTPPQGMRSLVLAMFVLLAERPAEHAKRLITKFQPCDTTQ